MGSTGRRDRAPVSTQLLQEPYRFDFFQAVRIAERMARERQVSAPVADQGQRTRLPSPATGEGQGGRAVQPVGYEGSPHEEAVRFRALPSLSFPASAVHEVRNPPTSETSPTSGVSVAPNEPLPLEMVVSFMGLTGPQGVLPHHYTSLVINRVRKRDFALRDFLDLFNHRAISLFHRAWEKYRFALGYERALLAGDKQRLNEVSQSREGGQQRLPSPPTGGQQPRGSSPAAGEGQPRISPRPRAGEGQGVRGRDAQEDLFTQCLFSLVGLGTGGLRRRNQFDDDVFLYYAGLFAHYPRSALSLEEMVADFFQLPVAIRQFQGQWLRLGDDDLSCLPSVRRPAGLNTALGTNVVIGERVWNIESKFRLRLGPLTYRQFRSFMPSAELLRALSHLVRCYVGPQFDFDVQLVLKAPEVPWCRLGGDGTDPACLGWNTWVRSGEFEHDVDDAVFPEKL